MPNYRYSNKGAGCVVCTSEIVPADLLTHHVTYFPEITIPIHSQCHKRLHVGDDKVEDRLRNLRPPRGHGELFRLRLPRNSPERPPNQIPSGIVEHYCGGTLRKAERGPKTWIAKDHYLVYIEGICNVCLYRPSVITTLRPRMFNTEATLLMAAEMCHDCYIKVDDFERGRDPIVVPGMDTHYSYPHAGWCECAECRPGRRESA